jgi:beta-lactamase superfamily II metal-dependent hydrolase
MGILNITLIDVGWGDSIFIEHVDSTNNSHYGLIDSNDSKEIKSTRIFIERFFRLKREDIPDPLFDFVLLSHPHDDHRKGLEGIIRRYGATYFLHPKSNKLGPNAPLLRYCARSNSKVDQYDSAYSGKALPPFGDVSMVTLWPHDGQISNDENNNSVVLTLTYGDASVVLTGDAEKEVWDDIAVHIPQDTVFFKVPHHGSRNGSLDDQDQPTWLPDCPASANLGISCMYRRDYKHPHDEVLDAFTNAGRQYYRTDEAYHLTVSLDGTNSPTVKYSHV